MLATIQGDVLRYTCISRPIESFHNVADTHLREACVRIGYIRFSLYHRLQYTFIIYHVKVNHHVKGVFFFFKERKHQNLILQESQRIYYFYYKPHRSAFQGR